jgi:transposase-like protein
MSAKKTKTARRKRYTSEEKNQIIEFVRKHDQEKGRGGKSAAVKHFGISPISLSTWIKGVGDAIIGNPPVSKATSKSAKSSGVGNGGFTAKIKELTAVATQIDKLEAELAKARAKFDSLKAGL